MKRVFAALLCLAIGVSFAQPNSDLEAVKQRALTSARFVLKRPRYGYSDRSVHNCLPKAERLRVGRPFFIRALVHPTAKDLERRRQLVNQAWNKETGFFVSRENPFFYNYKDRYRVPIFDQSCGYLFHVESSYNSKEPQFVGDFHPLPLREAQKRLHNKKLPAFVWFYTSLTPQREGYLWVAGSRAVEAFGKHKLYQIVDRSGKAVSPLEAKLKIRIFRESFVTSMGEPSAW